MTRPKLPKQGLPDKTYPATIQATKKEIKVTVEPKLNPCPRCGSRDCHVASDIAMGDRFCYVKCYECNICTKYYMSSEEAIDCWHWQPPANAENKTEILRYLYELDNVCAAAGAMIDAHTPEPIHNRFNEAWARIKRILHTIEQEMEATP